ncbi:MAG: hypothetical protein FJY88_05495 [Candidatus Eisenbacteria bacterium]|nr:hypothetical protein [Candidatus Eisenbacteria bacterium]
MESLSAPGELLGDFRGADPPRKRCEGGIWATGSRCREGTSSGAWPAPSTKWPRGSRGAAIRNARRSGWRRSCVVLEDSKVGITVADVSGKGAPAALLMSTFRASLRSQDLAALGPAEVLGRVNRFIHSSVDPGKFITAFLGLLARRR